MQYSKEKLEELEQVAETKGTYESVALHLGVSDTKLYELRRKNTALREILTKAIKRYHAKNVNLKDYVFTKSDLEEITKIVAESNLETAASKHGVSAQMFHKLRNDNPALDKAIKKGQEERINNTPYMKAMALFKSFDKAKLEEATKIAEQGGLEALEKEYGYSTHVMNKCRKELPQLELAIRTGIRKRPGGLAVEGAKEKAKATNAKKEPKPSKAYNKKGSTRKPPKEIMDQTFLNVQEDSISVIAKLRKDIEERRKRDYLKQIRNGDYDNMI